MSYEDKQFDIGVKKDLSEASIYLVKKWIEESPLYQFTRDTNLKIERVGCITDDTVTDVQNELASVFRKITCQRTKDISQYNIEMAVWNAMVNTLWISRFICTETRDMLFILPLCVNFVDSPFELFQDDACQIIKMFIF